MIRVSPAVGLYDTPRSIVVSHLAPGQVVTISANSLRSNGIWAASATYVANANGVVDLARAAPRFGSYHGVSPMGLFWSQHRVRAGAATGNSRVTRLTVSSGPRRIGSASVTQILVGPGVTEQRETIARAGFFGRYYAPARSGRHPAVIVWGGSEGALGVSPEWAGLLASHRIPALALACFDEPALPCALENIPLEYFVKAIRWLRSQPQVDPGRVWILSGSRGTEAELLVAAHWPTLVHGIVAEAPSSSVYGSNPGQCRSGSPVAWTLRGRPLPHAPVVGGPTFQADGSVSERAAFLYGLDDPGAAAARIPVERFNGAVMLISGGDDQLWPSDVYADQIMAALRSDRAPHAHLNYPAAGHLVFDLPYVPAETEERGQDRVSLKIT